VPDDTVVGDRPVFEHLQREIEMRACLNHPSLQRTLNQREKRQELYLVLEYLPGVTLRTLMLKAGTADLATEEIVRIIIAVCDALAYLHTSGVIHRDIKPEHILLLSTGEVKPTGLGIAEWLKTRRRNWMKVLSPLGTPGYLAPELWWGEAGSEQSDIYAVGVVLYELLRGQMPFAPSPAAPFIMPQLSHDPPDIREAQRAVSPALATVVMRTIRRDPASRYASMQALVDDLKHLDQVSPVAYHPARVKGGGSYRGLLFLVLLALIVLFGLIAFGIIAQFIASAHLS
jgi:serine/threonine protein kinase